LGPEPILTSDKWKDTLGTIKVFFHEEKGPYITFGETRLGERGWIAVVLDSKGEIDFRAVKLPSSGF
jgi:hypothetical protein